MTNNNMTIGLTAELQPAEGISLFVEDPKEAEKANSSCGSSSSSCREYLMTLRATVDGGRLPWLQRVKEEEVRIASLIRQLAKKEDRVKGGQC